MTFSLALCVESTPISRDWAWDSGPTDLIDVSKLTSGLSRHKEDIRGRVLEVGEIPTPASLEATALPSVMFFCFT